MFYFSQEQIMSIQHTASIAELRLVGIDQLHKRWGWVVGLGIVLVVLGTIAIGSSVLFTLASMVFVGWLLIIGGVLQAINALASKERPSFFIDLFSGLLYSVAGFLIVVHPAATAVGLTLMIAILLIFGGVFRIALAMAVRYDNRFWLVLHGVINLLLGTCILQEWPVSGLWVIGLFIGIDMLFNGWSLIMLGMAAKNLSAHDRTV
jgi:uncharacterized membrane protein HdeD (DUF308 family)